MDPVQIFGPTGLAIAFVIACVTQVLKEATGWEGKKARWLSLLTGAALGLLLGLAGLRTTASELFPDVPAPVAGALLGVLLGIVASGGYGMVTWLQDRGVQRRVNIEAARPAPEVKVQIEQAPPPAPAPASPQEALQGLGAEIEDLEIPSLPAGGMRGLMGATSARADRYTHPAFAQRPTSTVEDVLQDTGRTPLVQVDDGPYRSG